MGGNQEVPEKHRLEIQRDSRQFLARRQNALLCERPSGRTGRQGHLPLADGQQRQLGSAGGAVVHHQHSVRRGCGFPGRRQRDALFCVGGALNNGRFRRVQERLRQQRQLEHAAEPRLPYQHTVRRCVLQSGGRGRLSWLYGPRARDRRRQGDAPCSASLQANLHSGAGYCRNTDRGTDRDFRRNNLHTRAGG